MQNADAESRVHVSMCLLRMRLGGNMTVRVDMRVLMTVVFVRMNVHVVLERLVQSPQTDAEQHHTHEPLTPRRQQIHRQQIPQPKRQQPYHSHASRMAKTPTDTRHPGAFRPTDRHRQ